MTDPKPISEARLAVSNAQRNHRMGLTNTEVDELLAEVRRLRAERLPEAIGRSMETARNLRAEIDRLRARERELHDCVRDLSIVLLFNLQRAETR